MVNIRSKVWRGFEKQQKHYGHLGGKVWYGIGAPLVVNIWEEMLRHIWWEVHDRSNYRG